MKLIKILLSFQFIILICEILEVSGQREIYDRTGHDYGVARYRRQKKSRRPAAAQQYYASTKLSSTEDFNPNSYYNRMPSNRNLGPDGENSKRILIDPAELPKTLHPHHHHHSHNSHNRHPKRRRPSYAAQSSPCYYRNARTLSNTEQQGRFFWDLNLYNIIPGTGAQAQYSDDDCYSGSGSSYGGSSLFGGYGNRPQKRPYRPLPSGGFIPDLIPDISNSLNTGISGGSNNGGGSSSSGNQNPDIYDPVYDDRPLYDNAQQPQYAQQPQLNEGPNLTPSQIVGGVAQTVNSVIQTLAGNSQQGQFLRTLYNRNSRRRYRY